MVTAVEQGIWKLEQDSATLEMTLFRYGHKIDRWQENKRLSWEELHDTLLRVSYQLRGEKDNG